MCGNIILILVQPLAIKLQGKELGISKSSMHWVFKDDLGLAAYKKAIQAVNIGSIKEKPT